MPTITRKCPQCQKYGEAELKDNTAILCPNCGDSWGEIGAIGELFDRCPVCQARQFWVNKDFNQALGCLVMAVGIVLVPWTYGLSLPVFALVDWLLYRRIKATVAVCYKCASEFRGIAIPKHLKPFMHHIGLKYDKYR